MDVRISVCLFLLCVWWSVGALMVVSAEPTVFACIITLDADCKEGGRVSMICSATNLNTSHIVEWRTEEPEMTLRWGNATLTSNPRFTFQTTQPRDGEITQDFTITNLQRNDTDEYICDVRQPMSAGGSSSVASSHVQLSVLNCPDRSSPFCSPDGPSTVGPSTSEISPSSNTETASLIIIIAGASAGGVAALIFSVILVIICRRRRVCNSGPKQPASHTEPSNSSDTVFTTDQTAHSQSNIYPNSNYGTQVGPTDTNIYQDPDETVTTASTQPALSLHYDSVSITRGVEEDSIPLYSTPPQRGATACIRYDTSEKASH